MIIVTGTKRSGTSLWMQILDNAGVEYIGDKFPDKWAKSIEESNPKGFYESSSLRSGVYFASNPASETTYISPQNTNGKALKVFIPGLIKTDLAYIEVVIATIRHWKTYETSIKKMYKIEEDWWIEKINKENLIKENKEEWIRKELKRQRGSYPHAIEWFIENMELINNFKVRKFPIIFKSYESLLENPEEILQKVFSFIKIGDWQKGINAIEKKLFREKIKDSTSDYLEPKEIKLFDDLYYSIHQKSKIELSLYKELTQLYIELYKRYPKNIYGANLYYK